jgi:hypothetical protein
MLRDMTTNAVFVAAAAGVFIAAPVGVQTQRDVGVRLRNIRSRVGNQRLHRLDSVRTVARKIRRLRLQRTRCGVPGQRRLCAISDYSEAFRLDPAYPFAHHDRGSEYRNAELKVLGAAH